MPDKQLFSNNASTTLDGAITDVATSITVIDGSVFPTPLSIVAGDQSEYTLITIEDEIIKVTAIAANVLVVVRAQEGTTGVAHDSGIVVKANNTAESLESFVKTDPDGDRKGDDSVNIQPSRTTTDQVASGQWSVAIGPSSKASQSGTVAVGSGASVTQTSGVAVGSSINCDTAHTTIVGSSSDATDPDDVSVWQASIETPTGVVSKIDTSYLGYCIDGWGISGATEPTGFSIGDYVTDGGNTWYIFEDNMANDDSSVLFGGGTIVTGGDSCVIGRYAKGYGNGNNVMGYSQDVIGENNTVIGSGNTVPGQGNIAIGSRGRDYSILNRNVVNATVIGNSPYMAISESCRIIGPDYIPLEPAELPRYAGTTAPAEYRGYSAKEQTFFSPPICAGVNAWTASTAYQQGETVTVLTGGPTNFSYFARIFPNDNYDYFTTAGTSGGAEPTWPTTAGGTVIDNDVTWVCVDRTDINFYLPENTRLIPIEVGFIGDEYTASVTTQPTISWGVVAGLADWKSGTLTTRLTAPYTRHESQIGGDGKVGSRALGADVTSFGDGNTSGRIFWKGIVVETLET